MNNIGSPIFDDLISSSDDQSNFPISSPELPPTPPHIEIMHQELKRKVINQPPSLTSELHNQPPRKMHKSSQGQDTYGQQCQEINKPQEVQSRMVDFVAAINYVPLVGVRNTPTPQETRLRTVAPVNRNRSSSSSSGNNLLVATPKRGVNVMLGGCNLIAFLSFALAPKVDNRTDNRKTSLKDCFGKNPTLIIHGDLPSDSIDVEISLVAKCGKKYYYSVLKLFYNGDLIKDFSLRVNCQVLRIGSNFNVIELPDISIVKVANYETKQQQKESFDNELFKNKPFELIDYLTGTYVSTSGKNPCRFVKSHNLQKACVAFRFFLKDQNECLKINGNNVIESSILLTNEITPVPNFRHDSKYRFSDIIVKCTNTVGCDVYFKDNQAVLQFECPVPNELKDYLKSKNAHVEISLRQNEEYSTIYHVGIPQCHGNILTADSEEASFFIRVPIYKKTLNEIKQNPVECQILNSLLSPSHGISTHIDIQSDDDLNKLLKALRLDYFQALCKINYNEKISDGKRLIDHSSPWVAKFQLKAVFESSNGLSLSAVQQEQQQEIDGTKQQKLTNNLSNPCLSGSQILFFDDANGSVKSSLLVTKSDLIESRPDLFSDSPNTSNSNSIARSNVF